jgi:hypothetical protein
MHCQANLKTRIYFGTLLFAIALVIGCDDSAPTVAASSALEKGAPKISVTTLDGRLAEVQADAQTDIIIMATWCPYSKQLKEALLDQRLGPYVSKRKLQFVFSDNEWPDVEKELGDLVKSGDMKEEQVPTMMAELRKRSGSPHVFDPKFIANLPGDAYIGKLPKDASGFPTIMTPSGFKNRLAYLVSINIPTALAVDVLGDYSPDKKTEDQDQNARIQGDI